MGNPLNFLGPVTCFLAVSCPYKNFAQKGNKGSAECYSAKRFCKLALCAESN